MIRGAQVADEYFKRQAVEVRNVHGFGDSRRETWRPAKIHRTTSRGCEVIYQDGTDFRPQHVMFSDLRPMEKSERVVPKVTKPLLSMADIDAYNARMDAEAKARDVREGLMPPPQQQQLVLLRRNSPILPIANSPEPRIHRKARTPKAHRATPLSRLLREARISAGFQQATLAHRSKVSQPRLSKIECGDYEPTDDELLGLQEALGLDLDQLLDLRGKRDAIETHAEEPSRVQASAAPRLSAPPLADPPPAPLPPSVPTLLEAVQAPRKPVASEPRGFESEDMARLLAQIKELREENSILRETVVFYAGMERH